MFDFLRCCKMDKHAENDLCKVAYIFFNCDEWNSDNSMNARYNNEIFRDLRNPRRDLWRKVKEEINEGRIVVDNNNLSEIRREILEGDPTKANDYMKYGYIMRMAIH